MNQAEREQFFEDSVTVTRIIRGNREAMVFVEDTASPRGLVAQTEYIQHHREQAKGKGPEARVSRMIVDQMAGRSPRPL